MRSTVFCDHYRAMSEHKTCELGVEYSKFDGMKFEARPCFGVRGEPPHPGCDLVQLPTPEQLAARDEEIRKRIESIGAARTAIVDHLGGKWKKGMAGSVGVIDCPVCEGERTLAFTRAGYNGHIHARCDTVDCVSWME